MQQFLIAGMIIVVVFLIYKLGEFVGATKQIQKAMKTPVGTKVESIGEIEDNRIMYYEPVFDKLKYCKFKATFEVIE